MPPSHGSRAATSTHRRPAGGSPSRSGPAIDDAARLVAEQSPPFDIVFIDADKAGYLGYLELLLDSPLLAPGAVIAVDNTLLQGQPYGAGDAMTANGAAIASFNAAVTAIRAWSRC